MNINLHIDRLILDGVNIHHSQRHLLHKSVESELTRLFTEGGVPQHLVRGGASPHVPASPIHMVGGSDPVRLGRQIARSVYGGIGK
ncbi:hypothetical protein [Nitrosospira briensis]|uniref:hypothetical protein n=1 Tax=Nitrosospira briensis TaxID=35799 RepID=UPI0008E31458|nr:hypothetical protein [Nitrosospira briensis]SFN69957.1 hypothetical protein SAMN05216332_101249 [Nitrosospira briensis]